MDLVIDANVLIAAFIKKSTTREILFYKTPNPLKLYAPPFILEEISKYVPLLSKKTKLMSSEILGLVLELIDAANIELVEDKGLTKLKSVAMEIAPDKKDSPYFAVALYKNCQIWSNDRQLKNQNGVVVITTKELLGILGGFQYT